MSFTVELLDAAKAAHGARSDYRLAKLLGIHPNNVSNYRCGRSFPDISTAYALATLAGVSPTDAVLGVNLDRAAGGQDAATWAALRAEFRALSSAAAACTG